jgi:hypothetical protein
VVLNPQPADRMRPFALRSAALQLFLTLPLAMALFTELCGAHQLFVALALVTLSLELSKESHIVKIRPTSWQ